MYHYLNTEKQPGVFSRQLLIMSRLRMCNTLKDVYLSK